jgi:carboxylesterase type B
VTKTSSTAAATSTALTAPAATTTVKLGYEVHQGAINATGGYYLFSNVPYAQQPVGALRFQKPLAVTGSSTTVNNGSTTGVMCIQAYPGWIIALQAASYGVTEAQMAAILYAQAGQTESCLLLDVYVPAAILAKGSAAKGI